MASNLNSLFFPFIELSCIFKAFYYNRSVSTDKTIEEINEIVNKKGFAKKGDRVINLAAMPVKESGMVNTLKISEIK